MFDWSDGLKLRHADLWMDSRSGKSACFISHAHSDHIGRHARTIATSETADLLRIRAGSECIDILSWEQVFDFDAATRLTVRPAGHVLGSAMLFAERDEGTLLYTGDFKLREALTVPVASPVRADVLVMESTYGKPFFRFPHWKIVAEELVERCSTALREGVQPVVMGYSLGKAQEVVRILTDAGLPVTEHGAVASMSDIYERHGVPLGPRRRYAVSDFVGPESLDLAERGVLVAPPQVARSPFSTRFEKRLTIMMSGWGLYPNSKYRYGVDHVLPLSDHADFDELIRLVEIVQPKQVYTHHGFVEFVDELKRRGVTARLAKPSPQLELFD
jgi:putative mRNA 3-end processing factor